MTRSLWLASAEDGADAGTFLHRVTRLDPDARVRLREVAGEVEAWAWLPLEVLACRRFEGSLDTSGDRRTGAQRAADGATGAADVTVSAAQLLRTLHAELLTGLPAGRPGAGGTPVSVALPAPDQSAWFGALPPRTGWHRVDRVPSTDVARLVRAGAETFRTAAALAANANRVGAALLDHEAIVVSDEVDAVRVPLRVPQALARMGFLPADVAAPADPLGSVIVSVTPAWARFDAAYGAAYLRRTPALSLIPL